MEVCIDLSIQVL